MRDKRDLDLIRLLLLEVESGETPEAMSRYTESEVLQHVVLAKEAGLLIAHLTEDTDGLAVGARIQRLTWAGHDFLDAARNEPLWKKTMASMKASGVTLTFEAVKALLVEGTKEVLRKLTGGP